MAEKKKKKMRFKLSLAMPQAWFYRFKEAKKIAPPSSAAAAHQSSAGFCRNAKPSSYSSPVNHKAIDISFPERCSPNLRSPRSARIASSDSPPLSSVHRHESAAFQELLCPSFRLGVSGDGVASWADAAAGGGGVDAGGDFPGFSSARRTAGSSAVALTFDVGELERRLKALGSEDRRKYYVSPMLSDALPSPNVPDDGGEAAPPVCAADEMIGKRQEAAEQHRKEDPLLKAKPAALEVVYEEGCDQGALAMVAEGGGGAKEAAAAAHRSGSSNESSGVLRQSSSTPSTTSSSDSTAAAAAALERGGSSSGCSSSSAMWERDVFFSGGGASESGGEAAALRHRSAARSSGAAAYDLRLLADYTADPSRYMLDRSHRKKAYAGGKLRTTHNSPLLPEWEGEEMDLQEGSICTAMIVPAGIHRYGGDLLDHRRSSRRDHLLVCSEDEAEMAGFCGGGGEEAAAAAAAERRRSVSGASFWRCRSPEEEESRRRSLEIGAAAGGGRRRRGSAAAAAAGWLDGRAMVKRSYEPGKDFKESMEEMIGAKGLWRSHDMVELLQCYLALNSHRYHDLIVKVFTEVWSDVVLTRTPSSQRLRHRQS